MILVPTTFKGLKIFDYSFDLLTEISCTIKNTSNWVLKFVSIVFNIFTYLKILNQPKQSLGREISEGSTAAES